MADRQLLVGQPETITQHERLSSGFEVDSTLGFIGIAGLLVAAVGLLDLALVWYPLGLGNAAWQFGTLATVPTAFPTVALGLVGAAAAVGARTEGKWLRWSVLLGNGVAGVAVFGLTAWFVAIYGDISPSMEPPVLAGARKALVRSLVYGVAFGGLHLAAMVWLLRRTRDR